MKYKISKESFDDILDNNSINVCYFIHFRRDKMGHRLSQELANRFKSFKIFYEKSSAFVINMF